jgi:hypothetical protein
MLKREMSFASRLLSAAGALTLVALLAPVAASAEGRSRAASTRSDGGVTQSGTASRDSGPSSSGSSSSSSPSRSATPRYGGARSSSDDGGSLPAVVERHSGSGERTAVPRPAGSSAEGRRPRGGRGSHHGHGGHGTVIIGSGWYWDPWYYGPSYGWGWGWGPWWWGWGPAAVRYDGPYASRAEYGALDLDLSPDDVEVYVDGERVGTVDEYDGWPTYLWLPRGTYDVVFYRQGYGTLARQYSIYGGQVIGVNDRLERGESVRPEDLQSTSTVNRDERLRRNRERQEAAARQEPWRDRASREDYGDEDELYAEREEGDDDEDGPREMARLRLTIEPEDASLYLDGNFLGSAREIANLSAGLVVPAGRHRLEVVRPGYLPEEVAFEGEAGEELELEVELERE